MKPCCLVQIYRHFRAPQCSMVIGRLVLVPLIRRTKWWLTRQLVLPYGVVLYGKWRCLVLRNLLKSWKNMLYPASQKLLESKLRMAGDIKLVFLCLADGGARSRVSSSGPYNPPPSGNNSRYALTSPGMMVMRQAQHFPGSYASE